MSASKIRGKILVVLWAAGKPLALQEIADKIGLNSSSTMGYLLGLIKAKYVSVPETHQYHITNHGKQAIGMPNLDKNLVEKILRTVSLENAFHFYYDLNEYSDLYANNLKDFVEKIKTIDLRSIDFHVPRKDFESWIRSLGDIELAKKIELIRMKNLTGNDLKTEIQQTISSRLKELIQKLQ